MTNRMEGILDVTGVVEGLEEKTFEKDGKTKWRYIVKIGGLSISGFGKPPQELLAAKKGGDITVTYKKSPDGKYNNFVGVKSGGETPKPTIDKEEFKTGGDIPPADNPLLLMQDAAAKIGHHAREAFKEIYGQYPDITKDGQCAIVNTLTIFMSQCSLMSKFKMAKPGTRLEELMKNGN